MGGSVAGLGGAGSTGGKGPQQAVAPAALPSYNTTTQADMMGGRSSGSMTPFSQLQFMRGMTQGMPQQQMQQGFVNPRGTMSPEMQAYYAQDRANQIQRLNSAQQQMAQNFYQAPNVSPLVRQMQMQQMQPVRGLAGLGFGFGNFGFNNPRQMPMPMPRYQSQALGYRPNIAAVQENLTRVKPSVQKQQEDAQAARIAELEAQLAGYNNVTYDGGGGG